MNPLKKLRNKQYGLIVENTIMLAIFQFSSILMTLITSGYQTRVFGEKNIGILNLAVVYMGLFQLFIDFGFNISAVAKVSKHRDDKAYISRILTCVTIAKTIFIVISCVVLAVFFTNKYENGTEALTYWLYLISYALLALIPEYLYRGLEKMSIVTIRAVSIKAFATIMIFVFVRRENDYYMVPMFNVIGNLAAVLAVYHHLFTKIGVKFYRVSFRDVWQEIKESSQFFVARIASTVYGSVNGIILERLDPTKIMTGYYKQADYVISSARNGLISPVADSLYPHMMRSRNFKVIKKALFLVLPIITAGCAVVFLFAEPLCVLWLGADYGPHVVLPLRALMPVVVISVPNYILGFPTLSPMGLAKHANTSITFGTVIHVINLAVLFFTGNLSMLTLCILTCITEFIIMCYRIVIIYKNRHLLKENSGQ